MAEGVRNLLHGTTPEVPPTLFPDALMAGRLIDQPTRRPSPSTTGVDPASLNAARRES